jgi:hypothetical protein
MTLTIQLNPEDTLPSLLARLKVPQAGDAQVVPAAAERILFIVPPELTLSAAQLSVLRREAAVCGRGVALLTGNPRLRAAADEAGVSTFRSAAWAERLPWRKPAAAVGVPRRARPVGPAVADPPPGPGIFDPKSPSGFRPAAFLRSFVRRRSPWWADLWLAALLVALMGGLLVALSYVIPAASITVVPAAEPVSVSVDLKAIPDAVADLEAGVLPAKTLSVQVAGEGRMPTSGRSKEPSSKATGQVLMVNRTARQLTVPVGTVVATATGDNARFVTTAVVDIAPSARATIPIEAVLPGEGGNVRAGTITQVEGSLSLSVIVANEAATSGGGVAEVGVVTEEDQARLQAQLFEQLKQKALEQLRDRLEPGYFLPPDAVTYLALSPTFTPFLGDVSPDLSLNMSVQAVGVAVDTRQGDQLALSRLQAAMTPGTRLISDTVRYIPGAITVLTDTKTVNFSLTAQGTALRAVDVDAVRTTVLGMTPEQASATLAERFPLALAPEVSLGPDWLPVVVPTNVSVLPWRIRVKVDWDQAAQRARQPQ